MEEVQEVLKMRKENILIKAISHKFQVTENTIRKLIRRYDKNYIKSTVIPDEPYQVEWCKLKQLFNITNLVDLIKLNQNRVKYGLPIIRLYITK